MASRYVVRRPRGGGKGCANARSGKEEKVRVKRERSAGGEDDGGRKFTNDDEVLTIDITGDEEVETREPKRAKTVVDLTEE